MKLKEIPVSIYNAAKLLSISSKSMVNVQKEEIPVIVSLTSIPSRLHTLHLTIRSILNQEVRPTKIVLWLHHSLKDEIPEKLASLESDLFSILYSDLTCSHRKLVHSLELYPNDIIITCDDDMMYRKNWLHLLYQEHKANLDKVIANQTRYISYSSAGELLSYKSWIKDKNTKNNEDAIIAIGAEGVLYPPNCLSKEVTNADLFLELAPKADDLWFKVMAYLQGTKTILAAHRAKTPIPIIGSQKQSLKKSNIDGDKNKTQWQAITQHYNITPDKFL